MDYEITNMQKYKNYKEQFGRLNKSIASGFYLEAIFIEYAILEDRLESMLKHSGKLTSKHREIGKKLGTIGEMQREKKGLTRKYFSEELLEEISVWVYERNRLIHALMKQYLQTEKLQELALNGRVLSKTISNKVSYYNKALDKQNNKK